MIRLLPLLMLATPAGAHSGHIGTLAGHDHWVLGAGLGALAGAAAIAWVKGRRAEAEAARGAEDGEEPSEDDASEVPA
jgi:hypothetical protein